VRVAVSRHPAGLGFLRVAVHAVSPATHARAPTLTPHPDTPAAQDEGAYGLALPQRTSSRHSLTPLRRSSERLISARERRAAPSALRILSVLAPIRRHTTITTTVPSPVTIAAKLVEVVSTLVIMTNSTYPLRDQGRPRPSPDVFQNGLTKDSRNPAWQ
jgi:hypothetical protein